MYKIGVFTGKFMPLHKGHLRSIKIASKQVETLYVVICYDENLMKRECDKYNLPYFNAEVRKDWLTHYLRKFKNIKVVVLDQTNFKKFPDGIQDFKKALLSLTDGKLDCFFGGEPVYLKVAEEVFGVPYILIDPSRSKVKISATDIRRDLKKNHRYLKHRVNKYLNSK